MPQYVTQIYIYSTSMNEKTTLRPARADIKSDCIFLLYKHTLIRYSSNEENRLTSMKMRETSAPGIADKKTKHIHHNSTMQEQTPDISVIVPVYNAEATLARCLESLTRGQVQALEIICVNDGSTDSSADILEQWKQADSRIKVFTQPNAGVSAARNRGLQHVRGRYLAFVDADDEVTPDYLSNLLNHALQYDADLVVCGHRYVGTAKSTTVSPSFCHMPQITPDELSTLPPSVCSHLYATRAISHSGKVAQFPLGIRYGEDTAFHYALFPYCRNVVQCEENGYIIYYTEGSSNSRAASIVVDMIQATAWLAEQYNLHGMPDDCRKSLLLYAAHTMRRIHSLAAHKAQKKAAADMRSILAGENFTEQEAKALPAKYAQVLVSIISGGTGLNASYYFKRFKKWLRRK